MTRVAIYARFSSDRQSDQSVEDQVARCRAWVADHAAGRVELVCSDHAVSGASLDRPGWRRLESAIAARSVDVVVVESLDRVSRSVGDVAHLVSRLRFAGVRLVGIADGVDTSAASALMHTTLRGLMGESYLADLADKTRRGMAGRAREGRATGGTAYGYRTREDERGRAIEVDPDAAAVVRRIFASYAAGESRRAIAEGLNRDGIAPPRSSRRDRATPATWQASTIRAMLASEVYLGRLVWNRRAWVKVPGTNRRVCRERPRGEWITTERPDLAIVDLDTWARCNARSRDAAEALRVLSPADRRGAARRGYLLSGLLRCAACGELMAISGAAEGRRYYRCRGASTRGTCSVRASLRESAARDAVLETVRGALLGEDVIAEARAIIAEELAAAEEPSRVPLLSARVRKLEGQIDRLVDVLAAGASSAVERKLRELEADLAAARADLAAAEAERDAPLATVDELLVDARELAALVDGPDLAAAREALRACLEGGAVRAEHGPDGWRLTGWVVAPRGLGTIAGARLAHLNARAA